MKVIYFVKSSYSIMRFVSARVVNKSIGFKFVQQCFLHSDVRVRFAPSPTGSLHLGGLRTALYNYMFARSQKGVFILRLEDTDQKRLVPESKKEIENILDRVGITPDESPQCGGPFGPYIQSQRLSFYKEAADELVSNGYAYKCFCSPKTYIKKDRSKEYAQYDNRCRTLTEEDSARMENEGIPFCIRLKLKSEFEPFEDLIFGSRHMQIDEGDPVILKSSGLPTYHLANVVDDHHMKISHVIRGVEWHMSTPKHLLIYKGLNWKPPHFAHLPQLLNPDGSKLSKRKKDFDVAKLLNEGFSPTVILNFATMSGNGFPNRDYNRLLSLDELIELFVLTNLATHSSAVNRDMLLIYARMEIRSVLDDAPKRKALIQTIKELIEHNFQDRLEISVSEEYIDKVLECWGETRIYNSQDFVSDQFSFLFTPVLDKWDKSLHSINTDKIVQIVLDEVYQSDSHNFTIEEASVAMKNAQITLDNFEIKQSEILKTIRRLLSGLKVGPPVNEMMYLLGKERTMQRLQL